MALLSASQFAGRQTLYAEGTLAAQGDTITLDVTGLASAMIHVSGNGVMTLKFGGTADADGTGPGGRRLFKSGTGPLGFSQFSLNGAIDSEYRLTLGGRFLTISAPSWTSGAVSVVVSADTNPTSIFLQGPAQSTVEQAIRAGRAYSCSTSIQSIAAGNFLNFRVANPAGSGKNLVVFLRRFDSNKVAAPCLEYYGVSNPVTLSGTINTLTPGNFKPASGNSTIAQVTWASHTARLDSSPTTASPIGGIIAIDGSATFIEQDRIIAPGQSFGHYIAGSGGSGLGSGDAVRLGQAWFFFEEDIY